MTRVKLCGLTTLGDVDDASAVRPDFAGIVLWPRSKRAVADPQPLLARLREHGIPSVAVVVEGDARSIAPRVLGFDVVQLHGEQSTAARQGASGCLLPRNAAGVTQPEGHSDTDQGHGQRQGVGHNEGVGVDQRDGHQREEQRVLQQQTRNGLERGHISLEPTGEPGQRDCQGQGRRDRLNRRVAHGDGDAAAGTSTAEECPGQQRDVLPRANRRLAGRAVRGWTRHAHASGQSVDHHIEE